MKTFFVFYPVSHECWDFPFWLVGAGTTPALFEFGVDFLWSCPVVPSPAWGSFITHLCSSVLCWIPKGSISDLWSSPSVQLSPLQYSVLQTQAACVSPDSQLCLLHLGIYPTSPSLCYGWKLSTKLTSFDSCFSVFALLCCLKSSVSKSLFHIFCPFLIVSGTRANRDLLLHLGWNQVFSIDPFLHMGFLLLVDIKQQPYLLPTLPLRTSCSVYLFSYIIIIMITADPWLLILQKPTTPMAVSEPSSSASSAGRLGLQGRNFTEFLTDANVPLSLS